ncbi:alpha-1,2-fucosyltransferase [Brachyspira pilosicoli]|uniref:alpha-1,2-fucosyltransferase n=1 Tax=Brachyspira pilosicoli TaxID=52584 RepID=UPI003006EE55
MLYNNYEHLINKIVRIIPIKKHRDNLRNILYDIVNSLYKIEYISKELNKKRNNNDSGIVIIECQGGLADQFWKYILGESIKKHYNFTVKYDITWFDHKHKDIDGKDERPFELIKLCPDIDFKIASYDEIFFYKACFSVINESYFGYDINNYLENNKNLFLYSYPRILDINVSDITKNIDLDKYHYSTLKEDNLVLYNELKNSESVAIHIRLGDSYVMSCFKEVFNSSYENYANYFIESINKLSNELKNPTFFFFSDDIDWVNKNIIKKLNNRISYKVSSCKNPPYLDIYLMSNAKHYIISLGGFGDLATRFNNNENKIVIKACKFQYDYL